MTVHEALKILADCDPNATLQMAVGNHDGCDSCGWGESYREEDVTAINDLESRVVITV